MLPAQCKAARVMLGWGQRELAAQAEVGLSTVVDFERERRGTVSEEIISRLRAALEAGGVVFLPETDSHGAGVALRK